MTLAISSKPLPPVIDELDLAATGAAISVAEPPMDEEPATDIEPTRSLTGHSSRGRLASFLRTPQRGFTGRGTR